MIGGLALLLRGAGRGAPWPIMVVLLVSAVLQVVFGICAIKRHAWTNYALGILWLLKAPVFVLLLLAEGPGGGTGLLMLAGVMLFAAFNLRKLRAIRAAGLDPRGKVPPLPAAAVAQEEPPQAKKPAPLEIKCASCSEVFKCPEDWTGGALSCPRCGGPARSGG